MTRIIATKVVPRASALGSNGAFYVDKGVRFTLTRLLAQGSAYKDLGRNGQERAITPKAAYTPVSKRPCSRSLSITRSPAQKYRVRTSNAMAKPRPSRPRPLTLRLLTAPARVTLTRSPAQGSAYRTLVAMAKARPSRPRPLTLRSLPALARAHFLLGGYVMKKMSSGEIRQCFWIFSRVKVMQLNLVLR